MNNLTNLKIARIFAMYYGAVCKLRKHWYLWFLIISIICFIISHFYYKIWSTNSYYKEVSTKCIVIGKEIQQYNAGNNSALNINYRYIIICKYEGTIFQMEVGINTYYKSNINDAIYFNLSKQYIQDGSNGGPAIYIIILLTGIGSLIAFPIMRLAYKIQENNRPFEGYFR